MNIKIRHYLICAVTVFITGLSSCKKESIYTYFHGDWNLIQENHNGIIQTFPPADFDWSVPVCDQPTPTSWCSSNVIYAWPTQGSYGLFFRFSQDQKWLYTQNINTIDSQSILVFTQDSLILHTISPGADEVDTWIRSY